MEAGAPKPKRGPGRPPRKVQPASAVLGIVKEPVIADPAICLAELSYYDPPVWKSFFGVLKSLKVRDVYFRFLREGLILYARDHMNNALRGIVDCNRALSYFCAVDELSLCVNRDNIDKMFPSINKNIDKISFYYDTVDEALVIQCHDSTMGNVKERRIAVCRVSYEGDISPIDASFRADDVKISFTLPIKYFKDTVTDATNSSDRICIEKHGDEPLSLTFPGSHVNRGNDGYTEGDKIDMRSTLNEVDFFRCTIYTFALKALCGSSQTQKVSILCREGNSAVITMKVGDLIDLAVCANAEG